MFYILVFIFSFFSFAQSPKQDAQLILSLSKSQTTLVDEVEITQIFLKYSGASLDSLKEILNISENGNDLHRLIYSDIDNPTLRKTILNHLIKEDSAPELRLLSDIDDTFVPKIHDKIYPLHIPYIGALTLYHFFKSQITFLTARPEAMEAKTHLDLKNYGLAQKSVLSGNIEGFLSKEKMAQKKITNAAEYFTLYPNSFFIFIGDNGQADLLVAQNLRTYFKEIVPITFIHEVVPETSVFKNKMAQMGIYYFQHYFEVAQILAQKNLLRTEQLNYYLKQYKQEVLKSSHLDSSLKEELLRLLK